MNKKTMSLREGILDALADDGETILQIENWLNYLGIQWDRNAVKSTLISMLDENIIKILYAPNGIKEFSKCKDEAIEEYWFELTIRGRQEQSEIEF